MECWFNTRQCISSVPIRYSTPRIGQYDIICPISDGIGHLVQSGTANHECITILSTSPLLHVKCIAYDSLVELIFSSIPLKKAIASI